MSSKITGQPAKKRIRRTKQQVEQLDNQILEVLNEDNPQSVRHIFYRMTDPRLPQPVEKSDKGYEVIQRRCVELRRSKRMPYGHITDMTRRGYHVNTFHDAGDFLSSINYLYRGDLWEQSEYYCEVWCESRSIAGVIESECRELAVSLYPAGGFSSLSLIHSSAQGIAASHNGRPIKIFYVGDYDQAGVLIDVSIEKELRTHLNNSVDLEFQRIAVSLEQIHELDLPTKPRKETDKRASHIEFTVEAEAMPAKHLRKLLRGHIESLLPANAMEITRIAEEQERAGIKMLGYLTRKQGVTNAVARLIER